MGECLACFSTCIFLKTLGREWGSYELFSRANFHRRYMQATTEALCVDMPSGGGPLCGPVWLLVRAAEPNRKAFQLQAPGDNGTPHGVVPGSTAQHGRRCGGARALAAAVS